MGLWVQFFVVLNGGLLAGAVAAATMRYALLWANAVDRRAALTTGPARPRAASPAPVPRNASTPDGDASVAEHAPAIDSHRLSESPVAISAEEEARIAAAMEMPAPDLDLPEEWLETLAAQGIVARTCFEAVVHILRLEVGAYREALCTVEDRLRMTRSGDAQKLRSTLNDGESVIRIWFERQETALAILKHAAVEEADSPKHGAVMRMLQFQVDRHTELLQQLAPGGTRREGAELRELGSTTVRECLAMVHRLRDWVMNEIAELLREQGRLEALPDRAALDGATSIYNRVGLERAYQEWQGVNPNGDRPAALAVIHVDEFDRVNALLGTRAAELALRAFAELGRSVLRRNRGFDCVGRGGGVDLVVILGDTPSRQAISVVERLRQTIEESEFRAGPLTFNLTISSCVGECDVTSPLAPQIDRIAKNVRAATLRFGKNRTFVEGERGTEEVEAPPLSIKPKTVVLGSSIEIKEKVVE